MKVLNMHSMYMWRALLMCNILLTIAQSITSPRQSCMFYSATVSANCPYYRMGQNDQDCNKHFITQPLA